jgi:hypothetical protein
MRREAAVWLLLAAGVALAVIALAQPQLLADGRGPRLLYLTLLLAFVGSAVWARSRLAPGAALRNVVIWLAIMVALAGGYRLWETWTGGASH